MKMNSKIKDQEIYIEKLRQENEQHYLLAGERKNYLCETFGCPKVYQSGIKKA